MVSDVRFTVTPDHLALARAMYVGWDGCEYGAPAVDCKRPYGNGDVERDMREILGREPGDPEDDDYAYRTDELYGLHREMQTVLQIALYTGEFTPGEYVADRHFGDWKRVE